MNEEIITTDFKGYDKRIEGTLCRVYQVPPGEVTILASNRCEVMVHLSFSIPTEKDRDIITEELVNVEGIAAIAVHVTIIYIQYSILFDFTGLKFRILLALSRAFDRIFKKEKCQDEAVKDKPL